MKDDTVKPPDYSYKWFGWFIYFVLFESLMVLLSWGDMDVAMLSGGKGCTPRSTKDFCHFSSLKSEASPTQKNLNFSTKAWQCKL